MATQPDFAFVAKTLQETAQALLALQETNSAQNLKTRTAEPPTRKDGGETRSYYFPRATVNLEKELLHKYRADDFQGLLDEVYTLLIGLVKLMQSVNKDVRVKGYVIAGLGAQVGHAAALVQRMRNVYGQVAPVRG